MFPERAATVNSPDSIFHCAGPPFDDRQCDKSVPLNSTIASDGGAPGLEAGVTTGGRGRFGSCTCHFPPGSIGVSV